MIALVVACISLLAGIRWPGVLLAGAMLTYQAGALSGVPQMSSGYAVAALGVALLQVRLKFLNTRISLVDLAYLAFIILYALTATYSPPQTNAVGVIIQLAMPAISLFLLGRLVGISAAPSQIIAQLTWGLVGIGAAYAVLLFLNRGLALSGRLEVGDSNAVGIAQSFPLAIFAGFCACYGAIMSRRISLIVFSVLATVVIFYVSLISATRAVYVAVAASLIFVFIVSSKRPGAWKALIGLAGAIPVVSPIIIAMFQSEAAAAGIDRLMRNFKTGDFRLDMSGRLRLQQQELGWEMFLGHPLFGTGLGGYDSITNRDYPHNIILEIASQAGLFGLTVFVLYVIVLFLAGLSMRRREPKLIIVLGLLVATLAHMQFSFSLYMAKPLFLLTGLVASMAATGVVRKHTSPRYRFASASGSEG